MLPLLGHTPQQPLQPGFFRLTPTTIAVYTIPSNPHHPAKEKECKELRPNKKKEII
jgi:hypothetical protein